MPGAGAGWVTVIVPPAEQFGFVIVTVGGEGVVMSCPCTFVLLETDEQVPELTTLR